LVTLYIPGKPQGKARARTCKTGHSYTPENTVLYENLIKTSFLQRYGALGKIRTQGKQKPALKMEIYAGFQVPKSFSNRPDPLFSELFLCRLRSNACPPFGLLRGLAAELIIKF
jgi:hypothetical protein